MPIAHLSSLPIVNFQWLAFKLCQVSPRFSPLLLEFSTSWISGEVNLPPPSFWEERLHLGKRIFRAVVAQKKRPLSLSHDLSHLNFTKVHSISFTDLCYQLLIFSYNCFNVNNVYSNEREVNFPPGYHTAWELFSKKPEQTKWAKKGESHRYCCNLHFEMILEEICKSMVGYNDQTQAGFLGQVV